MRKGMVAALSAALGLGVVVAVAATGIANATPTGVHGLTQRVETVHATAAAHNTTEVQASCHDDELLTGGGYQVGSIGFNDKVYVNAPLNDKTWLVEIIDDTDFTIDVWAYAVCIAAGK
jgi:hypothetical protein